MFCFFKGTLKNSTISLSWGVKPFCLRGGGSSFKMRSTRPVILSETKGGFPRKQKRKWDREPKMSNVWIWPESKSGGLNEMCNLWTSHIGCCLMPTGHCRRWCLLLSRPPEHNTREILPKQHHTSAQFRHYSLFETLIEDLDHVKQMIDRK